MSVYTEAKIRKLLKELSIAEGGVFHLEEQERLTPSARSYLNDHHIRVVQTHSNHHSTAHQSEKQVVRNLEDSTIYPMLYRLTSLYPYFLKSQRELYLSFEQSKFDKVSKILQVLEQLVSGQILENLQEYDSELPSQIELNDFEEQRSLDYKKISLAYSVTNWKLALYSTYLAVVGIELDLSQIGNRELDPYLDNLIRLLHSIQLAIWKVLEE
ncbi:TPA: hypothetical protein U0431_001004 [Streptococcus suis]|nr:hypothetical protein [Streptococcus suis]